MVEENRRFVYSDFGSSASSVSSIKERNRFEHNEIRKGKRGNSIQTKRFRTGGEEILSTEDINLQNVKDVAKKFQKKNDKTKEHLKYLRNAFAHSCDFIEAFLEIDNALFALVGYLTGNDTDLQLESVWCVTNIAANDYKNIAAVVKATSAYLITFLKSGSVLLQDQSAWALGNMAAEEAAIRETLKIQGIVPSLIDLVKSDVDAVVQSALFALCNLSKSQDLFVPELIASNLPNMIFQKLNNSNTDLNIVGEIAWLLTYFTYNQRCCEVMVKKQILIHVTKWICKVRPHQQEYLFVVTPLLRCLGNILGCTEHNYIENLPGSNENKLLMSTLNTFLSSGKRYLIKECLWVLSNLFSQDLQVLLCNGCDESDVTLLLPNIVNHLNSAYEIRKEASVCVCNLSCQVLQSFFTYCSSEKVIKSFLDFLKVPDNDLVWLAMRYFELLSERRQKSPTLENDFFVECDGPSYLEALECHENEDIRKKAVYLLETFYEADDVTVADDKS